MTNAVRGAVTVAVSNHRPSIGSVLSTCVVFFAASIVSCALLGWWLPFPEVGMVRAKMEYLARHGDDYDVLFIGSSRVHEQIVPATFDRVAAANGVPVKSFNAGIVAMTSPEEGYVLEEVLRRPHRRLRWVFFEISHLGTDAWEGHTARFGYWHDTTRLRFLARGLWAEALADQSRLARAGQATWSARWNLWSTTAGKLSAHLSQWLMRGTNISRGSDALNRSLRAPGFHFDVGKELGPRSDGWMPGPDRLQQMNAKVRREFDEAYAARLASPAVKDRGVAISQVALERMVAVVTTAGARPVILIAPTTLERNFYPAEDREAALTILDYSDVQKNAELFAPKNRMDWGHVNTAGAEIFTEDLAHRFVELAKGAATAKALATH